VSTALPIAMVGGSFLLGFVVPRLWVLAIPSVLCGVLFVLTVAMLSSGGGSDSDPRLILLVPVVAYFAMALPMLFGVALGRAGRDE
jgi:hypothetical protein